MFNYLTRVGPKAKHTWYMIGRYVKLFNKTEDLKLFAWADKALIWNSNILLE